MKFDVTPLGTRGGATPDEVAKRVADYLRQPEPEPGAPRGARAGADPGVEDGGTAASRYYADRGATPGRWLGRGAAESRLLGTVDPDHFARVLAGRHPRTGARLITAQGSAGRRPTLGVGTATRSGPRGEPIYDVHDAAAALGCEEDAAHEMVSAGERIAMATFLAAATWSAESLAVESEDSYLVPLVDRDGRRWIGDRELSRCETARARVVAADVVAAEGSPDDLLSLSEAAGLAGVTPRYLRTLCRRYEDHEDEIEAVLAAGVTPKRAYLVGRRDTADRWWVRREDLVTFLRQRRVPAVRVGYDLTLTTEKSLGIVALLGDEDTRQAVLDAIRAGNDWGLGYLERQAAWARVKGARTGTRGWTVASFEHLTSRALDPFPHHHNVVANSVVDAEGTRRALDARGLYWHIAEASALATAEMRYTLAHTVGPGWRRARHGGWEIDGISDALIREFSQRRNDIEDAVRELEEAIGRGRTIDELQAVVRKTRPPKRSEEIDVLTTRWWERARALGLTPERLAALTHRELPEQSPPESADVFAELAAPWGVCADSSIFTRGDLLHALVNFGWRDDEGTEHPLLLPPAEFERLADDFLASEHVVELIPSPAADAPIPLRFRHLGVFTTRRALAAQRRVFEWYEAGRSQGFGAVPTDALREALDQHPRLTPEQRDLVTAFCTSRHQVQCAIGRAGTGKTSTMRAAVAAWEAAGYEVRGTAVKGEAARVLGAATERPSDTLAWYLVQNDPETTPLHDRMVLIVDEASTVSDRDLHKLLDLARQTGTTIRLVGDPQQHGAVGAGGLFGLLCARHPGDTPELMRSHRLRHPSDVVAADALREGDVETALAALAGAGHLHIEDDELSLYLAFLRRWWEHHRDPAPLPMVNQRNRTRRQLNRLAHRLLQVAGEVGEHEIEASGGRAFAVGDRVIARVTNRDLHVEGDPKAHVRNGAEGTVIELRTGRRREDDEIVVDFVGTGVVRLPRAFFDEHQGPGRRVEVGIDHAYAVTSYAVQGGTFGASASRLDEHARRAEAYVDITRGEDANYLYLTRALDSLDGERLPRLPLPSIYEAVRDRLEASRPELTASEVDPEAGADELLEGATLDVLRARRAELDAEDDEARVLRRYTLARARQVAREAVRAPDPELAAVLPERPEIPYLLEHWRRALGALAVYRERWRPAPDDGPWGWALGAGSADPLDVTERDAVIEKVAALVVGTVAEALRAHGWAELPSWAAAHVRALAARGTCRPAPAALDSLYRRIRDYRGRAGRDVEPEAEAAGPEALLGPTPADAHLAHVHRGLAHELEQLRPPDAGLGPLVH